MGYLVIFSKIRYNGSVTSYYSYAWPAQPGPRGETTTSPAGPVMRILNYILLIANLKITHIGRAIFKSLLPLSFKSMEGPSCCWDDTFQWKKDSFHGYVTALNDAKSIIDDFEYETYSSFSEIRSTKIFGSFDISGIMQYRSTCIVLS